MSAIIDEDAVVAALDLVGRAGGKECEFGFLDDDVPVADARWWARARFGSMRLPNGELMTHAVGQQIAVENHRGPVEALEALARRILEGGMCAHCRRTVKLAGKPRDGVCRWTRMGHTWKRGCE